MLIRPKQKTNFPTAGKWSGGGMRLTKGAIEEIPGARELYREGIATQASWKEIEEALKAVNGYKKSPLTPQNTPYFLLHQSRCTIPGLAYAALDRYGEDRGDGVKIYEFPIVFWDDVEDACQRTFKYWRGSNLTKFSTVSADTGERRCSCFEQIKPDSGRTRRGEAIKYWGKRPIEDLGPFIPNECPHFREGDCKHETLLHFRVPGLQTGSMYMSLLTKSIYSSIDFAGDPENPDDMGVLDFVQRDFGRIRGLFAGKPMFWLTKSLEMVGRLDRKTGKTHREEKELIRLITKGVDTAAVLRDGYGDGDTRCLLDSHIEPAPDPGEGMEGDGVEPTAEERVKDMRRTLIAKAKLFDPPWDLSKDLQEWMQGYEFTPDMTHSVEGLELILKQMDVDLEQQEAMVAAAKDVDGMKKEQEQDIDGKTDIF